MSGIPGLGIKTPAVEGGGGALYEARKQIYPQSISGTFRNIKWGLLTVGMLIYYFLPFVRWDRGPGQPTQAVLVDLERQKFFFFGIEIWPQEVYYITGLLILASFTLFLMNAVAGRIWCGYLCPQTVWTDLFLLIERWTQGDRRDRMKKAKQPLDAGDRGRGHPQAFAVADDRLVDRRRLGALFRRRAHPGEATGDLPGPGPGLYLDRHPHRQRPMSSRVSRASRCASTCVHGRASRRR